jgi:hypothetical protein
MATLLHFHSLSLGVLQCLRRSGETADQRPEIRTFQLEGYVVYCITHVGLKIDPNLSHGKHHQFP